MLKHVMHYLCWITLIGTTHPTVSLTAADDVSSATIPCTKEELIHFFPQPVVQAILIKANFPKEQAIKIAKELANRDVELMTIVENKAAKMDPNPFKDLNHRDLAIKIYRETLFEIFSATMQSQGVDDKLQIQSLLDNIQAEKSRLFIQCIRKQQTSRSPAKPATQ